MSVAWTRGQTAWHLKSGWGLDRLGRRCLSLAGITGGGYEMDRLSSAACTPEPACRAGGLNFEWD